MRGRQLLLFDIILLAPVVELGHVVVQIDLEVYYVEFLLIGAAALAEEV